MPLCRRKGPPVNTTIASVGTASFSGEGGAANQMKPAPPNAKSAAQVIASPRAALDSRLVTDLTACVRGGVAR